MIDFQKIDGPHGVPVYFQRLPVNTVSLYWLMFVGSADDESAGGHGIYHWFEHIPSRGTEKFPGGYFDTEARLIRHGGGASAETGSTYTGFSADIPKRVWPDALDILADMIGRPLLRLEDIEAEREIILQEINEWHSAPFSESLCRLPAVLWPGHPLGHDQLGTKESLQALDPRLLRKAHESGYSRNRCALFIAGDIEHSQLVDVVSDCLERIPLRDVSTRTSPASYGALPPWKAGQTTIVDTEHDDSIVYLLFPVPSLASRPGSLFEWDFVADVFAAGELGSPLNRLVREDSQLAYSPDFISTTHADGGYAGLVAQTSVEPERVVEAFWKLVRGSEIRSSDWLDYVRDTIRGAIEMHDPDAGEYTEQGSASLAHYGRCVPDAEYADTLLSYRNDEIVEWLDRLIEEEAHTIVFQGCGES
ncbi:MAG: insulinase family protein [Planctomycetales bacterium]|nr:insulinase family protein [Planctomycetales bacterium]